VDPRHIGQELDVTAVLDASYQRAGERFRATARLVETPSGRALWAGKVDVRFDDIFDVQDQVAHGIAEALAAPIAAASRGTARFTPDPRAYELLLRAAQARNDGTMEDFRRGLAFAEEAIAIQPDYAHAWAEVGHFAHGMIDGGFDDNPAWFDRAKRALQRALELDPEDPQANFLMGAYGVTHGMKREAWESLLKARRLAPNNSLVHHYFAYIFRLCDMLDEALAAELEGVAMDPSVPWNWFGLLRVRILRHDYDEARRLAEQSAARFPRHPRLPFYGAILEAVAGNWEAAIAGCDVALSLEPSKTVELDRALFLARAGRVAESRRALTTLEVSARIDMDSAALYAATLGAVGEMDRAFAHLDHAVRLGNDSATYYRTETFFGPLHADPRWKTFMEGVDRRVAEFRTIFRWPPPA
jgi:tetratricopeptide (TPR) repeat protein